MEEVYCVTMCHTVDPFVHTSLLVSLYCHEPLVWFKASASSLGPLSDILLWP